MTKILWIRLDGVRELHDGRNFLYGQIAYRTKIAPTQTLRSLIERNVGLDTERRFLSSWLRLRIHRNGLATHGRVLLPAIGRQMLHCW